MRVIPISSGKGGVGKTTFALNLALSLSKYHKTVLLDLDTGTSSLRHFVDLPFKKDLFHFFKKDISLESCLTKLDNNIDPENLFSNFSMIASPKNFIHDIVNFSKENKIKLIRSLNKLDADYLIIDHKAGLDDDILDFLPTGNTGILVFTPKIKAATLSAAEMVKASLLRVFNLLLNLEKYGKFSKETMYKRELSALENILLDFENSYDVEQNFDDLIVKLEEVHKDRFIIQIVKNYLKNYKVYFVLNQFNDVKESTKDIINPFIDKIYKSVSSNISITNLGWIMEQKMVEQSAEFGIPYMVMKRYQEKNKKTLKNDWDVDLMESLGLAQPQKKAERIIKKTATNEMDRQLDLLKDMITDDKENDPEQNFNYIADRIKMMEKSSIHDLGMRVIQSKEDIINRLFFAIKKSKK